MFHTVFSSLVPFLSFLSTSDPSLVRLARYWAVTFWYSGGEGRGEHWGYCARVMARVIARVMTCIVVSVRIRCGTCRNTCWGTCCMWKDCSDHIENYFRKYILDTVDVKVQYESENNHAMIKHSKWWGLDITASKKEFSVKFKFQGHAFQQACSHSSLLFSARNYPIKMSNSTYYTLP